MKVFTPEADRYREEPREAPLLDSLHSKVFAIISNRYVSMDRIAARLEALLRERYAATEVQHRTMTMVAPASPQMLEEIAGTANAAIVGLGNLGTETEWCVDAGVALQKMGVPSVVLVSERFKQAALVGLKARGAHEDCLIVLPFSETLDYGTPQEVERQADRVLQEGEHRLVRSTVTAAVHPRRPARNALESIELPGNTEEAGEWFRERGWTDGLPIAVPTEARVDAMLRQLGRDPGEVLGYLGPSGGAATLEKVAVNAVMAGCRPEYLPILVAVTQAIADPAFGLGAIQVASSSVTPMIIINGPVRQLCKVNCGRGALGPGWQANATIGRALRLMMMNIGSGTPGTVDMAVLGQPGKYTFCLGEYEEESPWEPLHVERGFSPTQSAVTVAPVMGSMNILTQYREAKNVLAMVADAMAYMGANCVELGSGQPVVVFTTGHAKLLAQQGFTKQRVKEWLFEHARIHADSFPKERSTANFEDNLVRDGDQVCLTKRPEDILIVVAGEAEACHVTHCPGFGGSDAVTHAVGRDSV